MPLFDYQCGECAHEFEALQGINDAPLTDCPTCGNSTLKKKISAPAFTFKGGGWYKDLYGSSGSKDSGSSSSKPSTTSKDSGKSEKKSTESKSKTAAAS